MSSQRPQRLPAAERRSLLVASATRHFAERGYEAADMASIAADAGVTKVIAYRAFGSKAGLYQALLEEHRDALLGVLVSAVRSDTGDPSDLFERGARAWFGYVQSHPFAWRMLFRDTTGIAEFSKLHAEMRRNARATVAELLSARGAVDAESAPLVAEFLRAGMVGLALLWLETPTLTMDEIAATAGNLTRAALSAT